MKGHHIVLVAVAGLAVAAVVGARRAAPAAAQVPAEAAAFHGAWHLYRNLAIYFGKRALVAEARYWEVIGHG